MSLFDISKSDPMRSIPAPNTNDSVTNRLAHGTTQNQNSGEIAEDDGLKFLERQIIAKQDGFNKAAFGFYGAANKFGLKVAEDGVDVLTAANDELIFNSEQNVFKIVEKGTLNTSELTVANPGAGLFASDTVQDTYAHNLGFKPIVVAFSSQDGTSDFPLPLIINSAPTTTTALWITLRAYTDTSNLYIITNVMVYGTSQTRTSRLITYYLLQETAN